MAIALTGLLTACEQGAKIEGSWVEPVPGMENMKQGFTLEENGKASSINMATLLYESWEKKGNSLILSGKSVGNHQTIAFTDTLVIEGLSADQLILKKGTQARTYTRIAKDSIETLSRSDAPAEAIPVKGTLVLGHEVRSFTAEGDTLAYWVIDKSGDLTARYDELTKGVKNGTPVYAELEVENKGKSEEGFAKDYAGVYHVIKVNKLTLR